MNHSTKSVLAKASLGSAILFGLAASAIADDKTPAAPVASPEHRAIDMAICLDTSGSMEQLIDAARTKIWTIVSDLGTAKPLPTLRVALLTFGNQGNAEADGWVKVELPFTEDLDAVSQRLFALSTNGGEEYVGRVVASATRLGWNTDNESLKFIIVAGNESADQDTQVSFRSAVKEAISAGILVNSVYCGSPTDELAPAWREVATLADGQFAAIDMQNGTIHIATPFDDRLTELSTALNTTYLPFGADGTSAWANQRDQDLQASSVNSAVAAQRCMTKGGGLYSNSRWDLVDACEDTTMKLEDIPDSELPEAMRGKSIEEKRAIIAASKAKRTELQKQVTELGVQREKFVQEELAKQNVDASKSFDLALRQAIRSQASAKGFSFATP